MKTANSSKLGKQHLPLHTAATGWERAGTSGEHWQDIPHQPTQRCSCCHCGDKKGQRNGSTVRNSAEILWRQENSKALELRAVFFFEATGLMAAHTALRRGCDNCRNTEWSLRGSSWMKTSCVSSTNFFFFFKATFLKILLIMNFEEKLLCQLQKDPRSIHHYHSATRDKKQQRKTYFLHIHWNFAGQMCTMPTAWKTFCFSSSRCIFVDVSEHMFFVCCSTLSYSELTAFSTMVLYLQHRQSITTWLLNLS